MTAQTQAGNGKIVLVVKDMHKESGKWVEGGTILNEEFAGLDNTSLWDMANDFITKKFKQWKLMPDGQQMVFRRGESFTRKLYESKTSPRDRRSIYVYF